MTKPLRDIEKPHEPAPLAHKAVCRGELRGEETLMYPWG
jgi:hypothetical protein